jgi:hypothetical protein
MTTIIAGRFEQQSDADHVIDALLRAGFARDGIAKYFVGPPGQHHQFPVGGDRNVSPGAEGGGPGAATGAGIGGAVGLAFGLAATPLVGPAGALAGAGVGAYTGSLVGALSGLKDDDESDTDVPRAAAGDEQPMVRESGVLVAVRASAEAEQQTAREVLSALGAREIERAEGTLTNGEWKDFNPVPAPDIIESHEGSAASQEAGVVFRVTRGPSGLWEVSEAGSREMLTTFVTQQEALDYANARARSHERAAVVLDEAS